MARARVGIGWLAVIWGSCAWPATAAEVYRPGWGPEVRHRVMTWGQRTSVLPMVVADGDELLSAWGANIVVNSGLACTRLSTGETLWTTTAGPNETLTAWLLDDSVILARRHSAETLAEHQWLDRTTGAVRHREVIDVSEDSIPLRLLKTTLIAGRNEVYDRRSGVRRGALPASVTAPFVEADGRLYAISSTDLDNAPQLVEIDLHSMATRQSWPLRTLFDERDGFWNYEPIAAKDRTVAFSRIGRFSSPAISLRSLAAIDLDAARIVWQQQVPTQAPLVFVDDLTADLPPGTLPPDELNRPLLVNWATGQTGLGPLTSSTLDLAHWVTDDPVRVIDRRVVGDVTALLVHRDLSDQIIAFHADGRQLWYRTQALMPVFQSLVGSDSTVRLTDQAAILSTGSTLEFVDYASGETLHTLTPESLGFLRRPTFHRSSSESTGDQAVASSPRSATTSTRFTLGVIAAVVLIGYLGLRAATQLSGSRSERSVL